MQKSDTRDAELAGITEMLSFAIDRLHRVGARPVIADHLLEAMREIADGAFEAKDSKRGGARRADKR